MDIELSRSRLRRWRPDDADSLALHANNRNISRWLRDHFPHPYTLEDAHRYIATASVQEPLRSFAIEVEGSAVGGISVRPESDVHRLSAEIGYWLSEAFWGRGIMTEAVQAVTAYGMQELGLVRLHATVFAGNEASARVLVKAGYQFEGHRRKAVIKNGQVLDDNQYAFVGDAAGPTPPNPGLSGRPPSP